MSSNQDVINQWQAGMKAPLTLYQGIDTLSGQSILVEAVGDGSQPVITKGSTISSSFADRIAAQLTPTVLGPDQQISFLILGPDGKPTFNDDGSAKTGVTTVTPKSEVKPITFVPTELLAEDDWHCDMCGILYPNALFKVGDGEYCKTSRTTADGVVATCFDLRIAQMMNSNQTSATQTQTPEPSAPEPTPPPPPPETPPADDTEQQGS